MLLEIKLVRRKSISERVILDKPFQSKWHFNSEVIILVWIGKSRCLGKSKLEMQIVVCFEYQGKEHI